MLLLTDLTSAPDYKSIGIDSEKVSPITVSILHMKSIAETFTTGNTQKVSPMLLAAIPTLRY